MSMTPQEVIDAAKKLAGEAYDWLSRADRLDNHLRNNYPYGRQQYIDEKHGDYVQTARLTDKYPALSGITRYGEDGHDGPFEYPDGEYVKWSDVADALLKTEPYSQAALLRMFPTAVPKDIKVEDVEAIRLRVRAEIQVAFKEWVQIAPQIYANFSAGTFGTDQEALHTLSNVLARAAARAYEGF